MISVPKYWNSYNRDKILIHFYGSWLSLMRFFGNLELLLLEKIYPYCSYPRHRLVEICKNWFGHLTIIHPKKKKKRNLIQHLLILASCIMNNWRVWVLKFWLINYWIGLNNSKVIQFHNLIIQLIDRLIHDIGKLVNL